MSAYVSVDVAFEDPEAILEALKELGFTTVEVHDTPQQLMGYSGDLRQQRANIIVRRRHIGHSSNDMGFIKGEDGKYSLYISDYDRNAVPGKLGLKGYAAFEGKLKQTYAMSKIKKQAAKERWSFKMDQAKGGKLTIRLSKFQ